MTRKQNPSVPAQKQLSPDEMKAAIRKIDRRLDDLKSFKIETVETEYDPNLRALEEKIDELLLDIFGADSAQYHRYFDIKDLYYPSLRMGYTPSAQEIQESIKNNIAKTIAVLETIKAGFAEKLDDVAGGGGAERVIKAYQGLDFHPEIARAANKLYIDGHYANAVEDAVKALNSHVKLKSGTSSQLDGADLMKHVFGPGKPPQMPVLKLNEMSDENDRSEQRGFMDLFHGAVIALRNPRAHKIIKDDPETALEYVAFISLLAKLVDKATK